MKFLLRLLLLASATLTVARAQTLGILQPATGSSMVVNVGGSVTVSGGYAGFTPAAISVSAVGATTTTFNATFSGGIWTATWAPTALGSYTLRASSGTVTSAPIVVTIAGFAPTVSLALSPTGASVPIGSSRYLIATTTDDGAIDHVDFSLDGALIGSVTKGQGGVFTSLFTATAPVGAHAITATAYDNDGLSTTSNIVGVNVASLIGLPPTVSINGPVSGAFLATTVATTISGIATDPDGTITNVQVFANGSLIGSTTPASNGTWTMSWTPAALGVVSLVAIATDDKANAIASPAVGVNVTDTTSPTITLAATPGSSAIPVTLPAGSTRNILATVGASTGRAVVRVEFFVNATKVGEKTTAPYSFRYTAPTTTGAYVFSARATDNTGLARDAQLPLNVIAAVGAPPTINLLTPTNGTTVVPTAGTAIVATSVSLAASAIAPGGSITSVQFYANGSPTLNTTSTNPVTAAPYTASFNPNTPGSYVLDAIATDDRGNTVVSNAVTITAAFGTPTVAITSPNPNATARATPNVPITISATAQGGSGAGVILVEYLLDGQQIGTRTVGISNGITTSYVFSWTPTTAQLGTHQLTARVTDTNSLTATSTPPVNIIVSNIVGSPPVISGVAATPVPTVGLQTLSTVNFVATAFSNATGGSITSVEFFLNDTSIGLAAREGTTNLYRFTYDFSRFDYSVLTPDINTGRFTIPLYAIAKDNSNNQTLSTTVNLLLNPSQSAPPTIQLVALSPTTISQGNTFIVAPIFADSDGTVTSLQLYSNGAVSGGAVANPGLGQFLTFTPTAAGTYRLFVAATDDTGNTAISTPVITVTVTATSAPVTALVRPTDDSTVTTVGAPVFLEATATFSDPTLSQSVVFAATNSGGRATNVTGTRIGTTSTYRAIFTTTTADTYTITSQATIGTGANAITTTSSQSRRVVVNNVVGIAPTVTISVPSSATSVSSANLTATATAAGGGAITNVEFFLGRNSIGQAVRDQLTNTWRMTASFVGLTTGNTEIVALARDSAGNIAASTTTNINITTGTGAPPSVNVFVNPTSVTLGQNIVLTATAGSITSTVSSVTYFANALNLGGRTTPPTPGQAGYQLTWTTAPVGTFNVYAVAADINGNTTVSAPVLVTVRRFEPVLDDSAFILQSYVDISNINAPNLDLVTAYAGQIAAGSLTRAQLVDTLITNDTGGFTAPVNLLAAYYAIMGEWPTPSNYATLLATARGSLPNAIGTILSSTRYSFLFSNGIGTSTGTLTTSFNASFDTLTAFATRLWQNVGRNAPSQAEVLQFQRNPTAVTAPPLGPLGRGYAATGVGLNTALAEFITITNSANTAFMNKAQAAALYYQLDKPPTPDGTVDQVVAPIAARIVQLLKLPDTTSIIDAALKDILYTNRYVTVLTSPQSLVISPRSGAIFSVNALGAPPLSYQWLFNGAPIPVTTNPTANTSQLSLTNVDATKAGTYTVLVSSSYGSATSDPATLTLTSTPTKVTNLSTRGVTNASGQLLIGGFVVSGAANQTRQMLIRVVGPSLPASVTGVVADPHLEVYSAANPNVPILVNDNWGTQTGGAAAVTAIQQAANRVGAFALNPNSLDAAVLATLSPGLYTVQAKAPAGSTNPGVVLIEVYDASPNSTATTPKPVNVSTRGPVGTGASIMIAGFVIDGVASRRMLIRGVGPTLTRFNVPGALADPQIELFDGNGKSLRVNDDWAAGDDAALIAAAANAGGAFPLANGSKDSAMLLMLPPGAYTVHLSGVGTTNNTGIGLVEVYDVDP